MVIVIVLIFKVIGILIVITSILLIIKIIDILINKAEKLFPSLSKSKDVAGPRIETKPLPLPKR